MHFLVLLCVLGLTQAAPKTTVDPHADHDHTAPCCMPKRWQAMLLDLRAENGLKYATLMAYDADQMIEGTLTVRVDDEAPVYQTFTDYKTMTAYHVAMFGDPSTHHCQTMKASHDYYDHCFFGKDHTTTASAVAPAYMADGNWGPVTNGIPFHAWNLQLGTMNVTIALSNDGCVPLVEAVTGTNDGKMINSLFMFNDFSTNVTTPEILAKPPACATKG